MIEETMTGEAQPEIKAPAQKTVQNEIESRYRDLILQVFNNPAGGQLLDLWDDLYIRQVTWQPGVQKGFAEFRAGQNQIVLSVRALLNQAKNAGARQ